MDNTNKQNTQSSADNEQAHRADKSMTLPEVDLESDQQEFRKRENSLTQRESVVDRKEQELNSVKDKLTKMDAELNMERLRLEEMELQAKNGFPKLFKEKFVEVNRQFEERETYCVSELKSLENKKEKLRLRELAILKAERKRDSGYTDARAKLDDELFRARKSQEKKMRSKRATALSDIEKEISDEMKFRLKTHEKRLKNDKAQLEQERMAILADRAELCKQVDEVERQKQRVQSNNDNLQEREQNLTQEVDRLVVERKRTFEREKTLLEGEIARLRKDYVTSKDLILNLEELKHKLGDEDPAAVLLRLRTSEEVNKKLRDDVLTRPTQEMQDAFDRWGSEKEHLELKLDRLEKENSDLLNSARPQSVLEMQIEELKDKNKSLQRLYESVDANNNRLTEECRRLNSSYERGQARERRIEFIEKPFKKIYLDPASPDVQELQWLGNIEKSCIEYGLKFPRRILHAFHTALKTSEWSPITVLAGVSGTGKSELPKLYSHFGGINFLPLSVQPNWDSKESMLGFFNPIDNEFDAEPVLHLLAQSQRAKTEDYEFGLEDAMNLILMDEMNLAYVELYFAEFLSKLELRRGRSDDEIPSIEVKLGAGIEPYDLRLGRNVLWAGTMNQDETTKSLSDKVLDRAIIINFPRPTVLERRPQLKMLDDQPPAPLLSHKLWKKWCCRESNFSDDQILPFKDFIEKVNSSLSNVGRALGHRVWQSIEYYMSNYPDVRKAQEDSDVEGMDKAMKIAFEDQLVQKVMPKLRGIETRGKSKSDCLDKIRTQLVDGGYRIDKDFDLAMKFGHGQFIWYSANYLKVDESANDQYDAEN